MRKEEMVNSEGNVVQGNQTIYYFMSATRCLPNGDPANGNKPRVDNFTGKGIITDGRLKRYIRDYVMDVFGEDMLLPYDITEEKMKDRIKAISSSSNEEMNDEVYNLLTSQYDVRLFGATTNMTEREEGCDKPLNITGPVQFAEGVSLNEIGVIGHSITNHFSKASEGSSANMGKKYIVRHGLYAFDGSISCLGGQQTGLTYDDLDKLDKAMLHSYNYKNTSSKKDQEARLYIRVENKSTDKQLEYASKLAKLNSEKPGNEIEDINDYTLDIDNIIEVINEAKDYIEEITVYHHKDLELESDYFDNNDFVGYLKDSGYKVNELNKWSD